MASHSEVAHNWASQTGVKKNGFNMYYDGDSIWSYGSHFCLARFFFPDGSYVKHVLINDQSYSVSTASHQTEVRYALHNHRAIKIYCADPRANCKHDHQENYKHFLKLRELKLDLASRARSNKPHLLSAAEGLRKQANEYSKMFKLGNRAIKEPKDLATELKRLADIHKVELKKYNKARAIRDAQRAEDSRLYEIEQREKLKEWLSGGDVRAPRFDTIYLRVKNGILESTWGIRVPIKEAIAVYRLARQCARRSKAFQPTKRHTIGGHPLNGITDTGTVRAGCHILTLKIQAIAARQIGLAA